MTVYDALIIGGGPAGSSAAWTLARAGARVMLLERQPLPRYKTCGGGVLARAWSWLPDDMHFEPERALTAAELRLADAGLRYVVRRSSPLVRMTMRDKFDSAMLHAAQRRGAEVASPYAVHGLRDAGDHVVVHGTGGPLRGRFVVGADGALGKVARLGGWGPQPPGVPAIEAEVDVDAATLEQHAATARFDIGVPVDGYAWTFPKRGHLSVGVLCMRRRSARLKQVLHGYLNALDIRPRSPFHVHGFQIPVRPRRDGFSRGRVLLAGDAAGLADPITGEGISYAILSGRLCGAAVLTAEGDAATARRVYATALRREVLADLRSARWLAATVYGLPRWRRALLRRCGQELCEALAEVIAGRRTYRALLRSPLNHLRLLRRLALAPIRGG